MTWALPQRLGLLLGSMIFVPCFACDASSSDDDPAYAADAAPPPTDVGLRFDAEDVLTASVGERVTVRLIVPGPPRSVAVWLDGVYGDASLDATDVLSERGRAQFTLRAPSTPAYFTLRASADGATAQLEVSVSAGGFADVHVRPAYAGRRPATRFWSSVFIGTSCFDLARLPVRDGAGVVSAEPGAPLIVRRVPAATRVAIATRIEHYASGCVDVDTLVPEIDRTLDVPLFDRPMALEATSMETFLSFEPDAAGAAAWTAMLDAAENKAASAFASGTREAQAQSMLDAMHGAVPVSPAAVPSFAAQFAERRASAGWDAVVAQWLDAHAPLPHDRVLALMSEGRAASSGDMVLGLTPGPSVGLARVALLRIGLLEIETAGVRARAPFGWTADPDDAVHLAGSMHLRPSAFVALAADHHARELVAGAADAPSALAHASQLDCAGLADQLLGATPTATSYEGCDAACTTQLCARGLANAWRAVREASTSAEEVQIGIAASAQARVGAYAEPLFFEGAWVGQVSSLARPTFGVKGRARGAQATSPF